MNKIAFLILTLLNTFPVIAQIEAKTLDYNNKLEISLEKDSSPKCLGDRIHSVNVIDVRDDTVAIGYYSVTRMEAFKYGVKAGASKKDKNTDAWSKVYHCTPSLKEGMISWMSDYFGFSSNDSVKNTLLIVVKKLWLSSEADKPHFDVEQKRPAANGWNSGVLCKLEFYLERDSIFYPLYRIDSIFTYDDWLYDYAGIKFRNNGSLFLTLALKSSLVKLTEIKPEEIIAKRRKLAFREIYNEYSNKNNLPILKTVTQNSGVYTTYDEFKNNQPSIKEYELRKGSMGDILFVKEGKEEYPTRNAWGYCDGNNIFINSGDKYSKLVRHANTFYFYGLKEVTKKSKHVFMKSSGLNYATNSGEKKSVFKMELKYYQIDMETGEAY